MNFRFHNAPLETEVQQGTKIDGMFVIMVPEIISVKSQNNLYDSLYDVLL